MVGVPLGAVLAPIVRRAGHLGAPHMRAAWSPPGRALTIHLEREARRATERIARIRGIDLSLAVYETCYGRGLPSGADAVEHIEANPIALDPYPSAVRARNLALAIRCGHRSAAIESALAHAARSLLTKLEWHLLGNHLLEDGVGLACAGLAATGGEARAWYAIGAAIVERELAEQFLDDGGHFERSATYHAWVLTSLLELLELHQAAGVAPTASWTRTAERALEWLARVTCPDGTVPLFNDAALDFCPTPAEVAELAASLGLHGMRRTGPVDVLSSTGWLLARTGDAFVVADVGAIGPEYMPGHAHADLLTFELFVGNRRLCVDFGVSRYAAGAERAHCRSTAGHNCLQVDGENSAETWGAFRVGRRGSAELLHWEATEDAIEWVAQHDGFSHLDGAPLHRRAFRLESSHLVLDDRVFGEGEHRVARRLRFDAAAHADLDVSVVASGAPLTKSASVWYPRHGVGSAAVLFESEARVRLPCRQETRISWGAPHA